MNLDNTRGGNVRPFRSYFEDGCLCVLDGTLQKAAKNMTDDEALDYYMANCKCSRHPNAERATLQMLLDTASVSDDMRPKVVEVLEQKRPNIPDTLEGRPLFMAYATQGRFAVLDKRFGNIASQVQQALRLDVDSIAFMGPDFDDDDVTLVRSAGLRVL